MVRTGEASETRTSATKADLISPLDSLTHVKLRNGEVYHLGDTVYLTPDFAGEPFGVARLLKFALDKASNEYVCLAGHFYRPKDVHVRHGRGDQRLLVASMHSEVFGVEAIKGKCTVSHKAQVGSTEAELDAYRKKEDCFYYDQFYDRFTQRFYDVVPVEMAKALPKEVLARMSNYDSAGMEVPEGVKGKGKESEKDSVDAGTSRSSAGTPSSGGSFGRELSGTIRKPLWPYRYFGEYNNYKAVLEELADDDTPIYPKASSRIGKRFQADIPEFSPKPKKVASVVPPTVLGVLDSLIDSAPVFSHHRANDGEEGDIKGGMERTDILLSESATAAQLSTLNPNLTERSEGMTSNGGHAHGLMSDPMQGLEGAGAGKSRKHVSLFKKKSREVGKVKFDKDLEVKMVGLERAMEDERYFSLPEQMDGRLCDEYLSSSISHHSQLRHESEVLDRALEELHNDNYDVSSALARILSMTAEDFSIREWSLEEEKTFETGVIKWGHDLHMVRKDMGKFRSKTRGDIYRPGKKFKSLNVESSLSVERDGDDSNSDSEGGTVRGKECQNCWSHKGPWKKRLSSGGRNEILCSDCFTWYLKYGGNRMVDKRANREDGKGGRGKLPQRRQQLKKRSEGEEELERAVPCAICNFAEEYDGNPIITCSGCKMKVHEGVQIV
ncbi:putative PHD type zinc finger protein with BAH domain-containing protein [Gonapodya sp. JEL0774]|nr:putative PHD type zinc finger protein with BAH domain-containing protein [Gonapodya sp. JEL0774]